MEYAESFKVRVTNKSKDRVILGKSDGSYTVLPEGFGIVGRISGKRPEHTYPDIIDVLNTLRNIKNVDDRDIERYRQIINDLKIDNTQQDKSITWNNRINKLQHKLESLKYHSNNFKKHEIELENEYKNEYTNVITDFEELDPIFTYETEAYLFQTKSSLYIFAQIIGLAFRLTGIVTYTEDGKDLIDKIQKTSSHRDFALEKNQLITIIDTNREWISYFVNMRDLVTHFSDLINFQSSVHKASFSEDAEIYYPNMPDRKRVTQYMDETWTNLVNLIKNVSIILQQIYNKIPPSSD